MLLVILGNSCELTATLGNKIGYQIMLKLGGRGTEFHKSLGHKGPRDLTINVTVVAL